MTRRSKLKKLDPHWDFVRHFSANHSVDLDSDAGHKYARQNAGLL
jgi:hypothetical protein